MIETTDRNVRVRFFKKDEDNLTFIMKKTGIKNQSSAIRLALDEYRKNAELIETLREIKNTQKEIINQNNFLKEHINAIFD